MALLLVTALVPMFLAWDEGPALDRIVLAMLDGYLAAILALLAFAHYVAEASLAGMLPSFAYFGITATRKLRLDNALGI